MNTPPTSARRSLRPFLLRMPSLTTLEGTPPEDSLDVEFYESARDVSGVTAEFATDAEFFTQTSILAAARREVEPNALWITFDDVSARSPYRPGIALPIESLGDAIEFGSTKPIDQNKATPEPAWWTSRSVQECSTFNMVVCSMESDHGARVTDVMRDAALRGEQSVFVRLTRLGVGGVVPVSADLEENYRLLVRRFGWRVAEVSKGIDDILVTPALEPRREFRAWVIRGALVAGAGIVPSLDPRHGMGSALDLQNTVSRGARDVGISEASDVEMLAELTRTLISQNAKIGGDLPESYVVDLAIDDDLPTIIDLNSIVGTAFYAADPGRVIRALVA